jgi:hypothetical protein
MRTSNVPAKTLPGVPPGVLAEARVVATWFETIGRRLNAADARTREQAFQELVTGAVPGPLEPAYARTLTLDSLRKALESADTALGRSPEAHLALAELAVAAGDPTLARRALLRAASVARQAPRERASWVNAEACKLWSRLGDNNEARNRWKISRYYQATTLHRSARLSIPWAPPVAGEPEHGARRVPLMGPPSPPLKSAPPAAHPPHDVLPPNWHHHTTKPAGAGLPIIELLNTLGAFIHAHHAAMEAAAYIAEREQARIQRDLLPAPPRPREVAECAAHLRCAAIYGTRLERRAARRVLASVDFEFLEEASWAYWGNTR